MEQIKLKYFCTFIVYTLLHNDYNIITKVNSFWQTISKRTECLLQTHYSCYSMTTMIVIHVNKGLYLS